MKANEVKILYGIAAQSVSIDQQTNAVSLFNVLEDMQFSITVAERKPIISIPFQFDYIGLFSRTDTAKIDSDVDFSAAISFIDPDGKVLITNPVESKVEKGKKRMRVTLKFPGISLTRTGTYTFRLDLLSQDGKAKVESVETNVDVTVEVTVKPKN